MKNYSAELYCNHVCSVCSILAEGSFMRPGFDSEKYLEEQSHAILERAAKFGEKRYLE